MIAGMDPEPVRAELPSHFDRTFKQQSAISLANLIRHQPKIGEFKVGGAAEVELCKSCSIVSNVENVEVICRVVDDPVKGWIGEVIALIPQPGFAYTLVEVTIKVSRNMDTPCHPYPFWIDLGGPLPGWCTHLKIGDHLE
jgi:hypothetical protein